MPRRTVDAVTAAATEDAPGAPGAPDVPGEPAMHPLHPLRTQVTTRYGDLAGVPAEPSSVTVFRGVPYAATTAGENRWRPPRAPEPWTGVRVADTFGSVPPQEAPTPSFHQGEDCLNLNVWTAAGSSAERRPVLVWVHGGRFLFGHGSEPAYDGARLASRGPVVVTLNYRMGVLGFLATGELSAESGHAASGNYGLLDIMAALAWVRDNIAAFGGDPDRVTVAGQSSGGASVMDLVYSPLARGLFHGAVVESAALHPRDPSIATLAPSPRQLRDAEEDGTAYAAARGAHTLRELRDMPLDQLVRGTSANDTRVPGTPGPPLFRPVIDGHVLPHPYGQTLARGLHADIPMLVGGNKDESGVTPRPYITLADYRTLAATRFGDFAEEFLKLYPAATDAEAGERWNTALRDCQRLSVHLWATERGRTASHPAFTYYWSHVPTGAEERGSYHGSEINYFLDTLAAEDRPHTALDHAMADTLASHLVRFVTTGDPGGPGLPAWRAHRPDTPVTHELGSRWGALRCATPEREDLIRRFFAACPSW